MGIDAAGAGYDTIYDLIDVALHQYQRFLL